MSETFIGPVEVQNGSGVTTVLLDSNNGNVRAGGSGQDGSIVVRNAADFDAILITGETNGAAGLYLTDGAGNDVIERHL